MTRHMRSLPVFLTATAAVAMTLLVALPTLWALNLSAAIIRFEINGTAGGGGVQFFLDGPQWKRCTILRPDGRHLITIETTVSHNSSRGTNGLTELLSESAEPSFAAQSLRQLLRRFPAGNYTFNCQTTDDQPLNSVATLTHKLPATPDPQVVQANNVVKITWPAVVGPFQLGGQSVVIVSYEVIVERSDGVKFDITLPAKKQGNSVTVPPEFITSKTNYKGEVLAIEQSGNQTIGEFEFETN